MRPACFGAMLTALLVFAAGTPWTAGQARAYGLFTCVDPAGREVCVVDSGTRTGFSPSALCNASCPACAGRCDAARRHPERTGRWVETWRGTPGQTGDNRFVPGPDAGEDARTIVREGLVEPRPDQPLPPPARQ